MEAIKKDSNFVCCVPGGQHWLPFLTVITFCSMSTNICHMQAGPLWILGTWLKKSAADAGAEGLDPMDHVMNQSLDYIDIWI